MDYINDLHELCETVSKEIGEANDKIRSAGGKLTAGDADYIDKLTHTLKSIKAVIAMMEDEDGYSNRAYPDMGGSYRYGGSYRGSYARGRGARRDGMGRYSRDGGMADELRNLMQDAPENIKHDLQRVLDKLEH